MRTTRYAVCLICASVGVVTAPMVVQGFQHAKPPDASRSDLLPDLVLSDAEAPSELIIGKGATVSWTVHNAGAAPGAPPWNDAVLLMWKPASADPGSTISGYGIPGYDLLLTSSRIEDGLDPKGHYVRSAQVTVPPDLPPGIGYKLAFLTDANDDVREGDEANNAKAIAVSIAEQMWFTITPSAGDGGSIFPRFGVSAYRGMGTTFSAVPGPGHAVDTWHLDGEPIQAGGVTYALADIQADHTVHVTFIQAHGYALDIIEFEDPDEFETRVANNNVVDPIHPGRSRNHVQLTDGLTPESTGAMLMQTQTDNDPTSPTYGQEFAARAKGTFASVGAANVLVRLNYLFLTARPGMELVVYLSDSRTLLDHDDPAWAEHTIMVGSIPVPPPPRPGSVGSGRYGVFAKTVPIGMLDLSMGAYVELELVENPPPGDVFMASSGAFASSGSSDSSVMVDSLGPEVHCEGICLDVTWDDFVNEVDFMTVVAACGCGAGLGPGGVGSRACLEGGFSDDGFVDLLDVAAWDWTLDADGRKNLCGGIPLSGESAAAFMAADAPGTDPAVICQAPAELGDLAVLGKRSTLNASGKLEDLIYAFDADGQYLDSIAPAVSNRTNVRLVKAADGRLYQVNSEIGVICLDAVDEIVVPAGQVTFASEPRYGVSAVVSVAIQGEDQDASGRPILDAVVEGDYAYVVPVVVSPTGQTPYVAAAKLELLDEADPPYRVVQIYDDPPPAGDNQYRDALREIEVDEAGNVYVINAHSLNESDILWRYYPDGTFDRVDLDTLGDGNDVPDPLAMHMSDTTGTLYVASGQYNELDISSAVISGFSTAGELSLDRTITIGDMQLVSAITEDASTRSLWVVGFNMADIPDYPNPWQLPFYQPRIAHIRCGQDNVQAEPIAGAHDLALPMSAVWIGSSRCDHADLDDNGEVDFADFAALAERWLGSQCEAPDFCGGADLDASGAIDTTDLALLLQCWLQSQL